MSVFDLPEFQETAPGFPHKGKAEQPEYGRRLDDFTEGETFLHPRAMTIDLGFALDFATTFHESNPLFLSVPHAKASGFRDLPVHPLLVFNVVLSLGVQNNSEKAIANLGYYNVQFPRPGYPGDTLRACTRVLGKRERGDKPGIVHVQSAGVNQNGEVLVSYERKIMVPPGGGGRPVPKGKDYIFPESDNKHHLPDFPPIQEETLTGSDTYFEHFTPNRTLLHKNMRTISDEHIPLTYRFGNTHPLHYDRLYSLSLTGPMSGEPIVYGGLVFAWLAGLASRDTTENMLWDLGYTEGYHTKPAFTGDTIGSISRVLACQDGPIPGTGVVQFQLIGVKNITTKQAFQKYGEALFIKENTKKSSESVRIPEKIFEIERRVLLKKKHPPPPG